MFAFAYQFPLTLSYLLINNESNFIAEYLVHREYSKCADTHTHTHTHTHTSMHARTHARSHARTHAGARAPHPPLPPPPPHTRRLQFFRRKDVFLHLQYPFPFMQLV